MKVNCTKSILVSVILMGLLFQELVAGRPNVIVVFTDDHGWADLGVHGILDDIKTPHLDEMARSGVWFNSGYITAPQCIPSRAGILSGSYQQSFGTDDNRFSPMPAEVLTVPERLQEAGYTTGMVGKWHLDPNPASQEWLAANTYKGQVMPPQNERRIPLADLLPYKTGSQGFDEFFEGYIYDYWANFNLDGKSLNPEGEYLRTEKRDRLDIQTDAAMAFIDRNHDDPFYLYLSYFAPHVPLESSEKYLSRFPGEMPERRRYALAMISAVDEGVGRIREQLREYGELDDTLIFFIGDNGAPLKITMEDIPLTHKGGAWDGSMNTPLNGEKGMLAEGGIRVPYIMSWPDRIAPGQVSDLPVSSLDVGATVVDLAGLPRDEALDGENLLELLDDPNMANQRPLFWRFWNQAAIRVGDWKYLRAGKFEFLFNVVDDYAEQNNLAQVYPERLESLRTQWREWDALLVRPFAGDSGRLNDQEQAWYTHYFGAGEAPQKQLSSEPQWEARHAVIESVAEGIKLKHFNPNAPHYFITVNRLEIGLDAMLRIKLNAEQSGTGQIQIRCHGESGFSDKNQVEFKFAAGVGISSIDLRVPPGKTLEHLRMILPFQDQALRIRSIDVFTDGRVLHRWDY
jgi:arylsulfatase A-like enzyme